MATLTKTVTLSSVAGAPNGILSDPLSISMSKALTVSGPHTLKKVTVLTAANGSLLVEANADKRTLVYIKNNASAATGNLKIYHDSTTEDGLGDDDPDSAAADAVVETYELIMEIAFGEFALFPATLDFPIRAVAASQDAPVEVGTFVIGDDFA